MRAARFGLPLVDREVEVLRGISEGGSYQEIAAELVLAHASVKNYAASAIKKLGARSQAHAVFLACRAGLLDGRPQRHGDHAGYEAHRKRGEDPKDCPHGCWAGEQAHKAAMRARQKP
ncbi:response regulator transcription factor [Streptomyces katrae]|uniref:response regulator transcription factor n=1 Tax=Streptomyces katrae TaxID=68223 RepID=UPI0006915AC8|nr:helix-turn-helix transcriptional regulator [Streptomyces katrae]